jgi:hypothetical protein
MAEISIPQIQLERTAEGILIHISPEVTDVALLAACVEHAAAQLRVLAEVNALNGNRVSIEYDSPKTENKSNWIRKRTQ